MYYHRHVEDRLKAFAKLFKIVLITGARQVGKSTILANTFPTLKSVVFDPIQDIYHVKADPDRFLDNFPSPLILDEVQYRPELLPALKRRVDQSDNKGQYFLTGSQNLAIMKSVVESLAGRVGILHLDPFSPYEFTQQPTLLEHHWLASYLNNPTELMKQFKNTLELPFTLYEQLWRGDMPGLLEIKNDFVSDYFSSYVQTYVERDIRVLGNIQELSQFDRFIGIVAALTGQEINYSQLGREIGIAPKTANQWLNLLNYTYQWREVWPYENNAIKRVSKKRKGYLTDTGMACYLQRISSADALARNPLLGAIFETYCVNMIFKLLNTLPIAPKIYHWRTAGGAEVDIILERDGKLFPIEIKCKSNISKHDARGIKSFQTTYPNVELGLILYTGNQPYFIDDRILVWPWNSIVM